MSREELLAKLDAYLGTDGWENLPNAGAEKDGCSIVTQKREPANATSFFIKCVQTFSDLDHKMFYEIISDVETRTKWDDGWVDAVIVQKEEQDP